MLGLIKEGMLVIEPKKRWKIDQVCTEISHIKELLEPKNELMQAIDVTLGVATHEVVNPTVHLQRYILIYVIVSYRRPASSRAQCLAD